jgi:hypothetical protein
MEESDTLRELSDAALILDRATALSQMCRKLHSEFQTWQRLRGNADGAPQNWLEPSTIFSEGITSSTDNGFHFASRLCFPDLETAYSQLLIWTSFLLLYGTHYATCRWLKQVLGPAFHLLYTEEDAFSYPENQMLLSETHSDAVHIAQAMEFFIKPEIGGLGVGLIGFPVSVAMGYFDHFDSPGKAWCRMVLRYVKRKYAVPLDDFLESMFNSEILKLIKA